MTSLFLPLPGLTSLFATSTALLLGGEQEVPEVTNHIACALVLFDGNPEYASYRSIIDGFRDVSKSSATTRDELAEELYSVGQALTYVTSETDADQDVRTSLKGLTRIIRASPAAPKPAGGFFAQDVDHLERNRERMLLALTCGVYHDVNGIVSGSASIFQIFEMSAERLAESVGVSSLREEALASVAEARRYLKEALRALVPLRLAIHFSVTRAHRRLEFLESFRNGDVERLGEAIASIDAPMAKAFNAGERLSAHFESAPIEGLEGDIEEMKMALNYLAGRKHMLANGVDLIRNLTLFHEGMDARVRVPVSLHDAIDPVMIQSLFGKRIALTVQLEPDPVPVMGPVCQLTQIVYNLVANAVEAIYKKGEVTIITEKVTLGEPREDFVPDHYMRLTVRDDGVGIPEAMIPNIFLPGVSGRGSSGLGLYVIREIIRDMGGNVQLKTSTVEPTGTSFFVYLPAVKP